MIKDLECDMKKFLFLVLALVGFSIAQTYAQQSTDTAMATQPQKEDTWKIDFDDVYSNIFGPSSDQLHHSSPTIEMSFGINNPDYSNSNFKENNVEHNMLNLKLGTSNAFKLYENPKIIEYNFGYMNISNTTRDFPKKYTDAGLKLNSWSIGMHNSDGYGYRLWENGSLILFHTEGFDWNVINFSHINGSADTAIAKANKDAINLFDNHVRFGKTWESGAKLYITKGVAINASYQRSLVYPRHLFFYDLVSSGVEVISQQVLNQFLEHGRRESLQYMPVVRWVLKSALSYGLYELRRENMNWPIKTAEPFMFESAKVGLTFSM